MSVYYLSQNEKNIRHGTAKLWIGNQQTAIAQAQERLSLSGDHPVAQGRLELAQTMLGLLMTILTGANDEVQPAFWQRINYVGDGIEEPQENEEE